MMTSKEVIDTYQNLLDQGYNPNYIRLDLDTFKNNLSLHIQHSNSFDELRSSLETYLAILGEPNND